MKALFRAIFLRTPKIGERFYFDDDNPFLYNWEVEVTDTRSGWVQYKYVDVSKYGDRRKSLTRFGFHFCYKRSSNQD